MTSFRHKGPTSITGSNWHLGLEHNAIHITIRLPTGQFLLIESAGISNFPHPLDPLHSVRMFCMYGVYHGLRPRTYG